MTLVLEGEAHFNYEKFQNCTWHKSKFNAMAGICCSQLSQFHLSGPEPLAAHCQILHVPLDVATQNVMGACWGHSLIFTNHSRSVFLCCFSPFVKLHLTRHMFFFLSLSLIFSVCLLVLTEVALKGSFSIITALTPYSHPQLESVALTSCTICALFSWQLMA